MLIAILYVVNAIGIGQPLTDSVRIVDLRKEWKVLGVDNVLQNYTEKGTSQTRVVYLKLDKKRSKNAYLKIDSHNIFSIFLNHKLLVHRVPSLTLNLDSLTREHPSPWLFGIHQIKRPAWLTTKLIFPNQLPRNQYNTFRETSHFMNFSIIASLIMLALLSVLLRNTPHFLWNYSDFLYMRITQKQRMVLLNNPIWERVNSLYYLFVCMLSAFVLLTVFHFATDKIAIAEYFPVRSTGGAFYQWLKLSGIIIIILLAKFIIVGFAATLFEIKANMRIQFYNQVKSFFFTSAIIGMVCVIYFITQTRNQEAYGALMYGIVSILAFWTITVALKLSRQSIHTFSYLFPYLCVSEFIPMIIIVRMLTP